MWGIIATWRMALEGVQEASQILQEGGFAGDAIECAIKNVEDFPYYKSVGYGGLPNVMMQVELDAAYMNGTTLDFGAVCAIKDFANPISIARALSHGEANNILVADGAELFAAKHGFPRKNMLTERAKIHYHNKQFDLKKEPLSAYDGHDTVGMISLDNNGQMVSGTSTSGLFMKEPGRVGDSPFIGSGLYVDSQIGGASATGLGEDIMKGVISYQIVSLMKAGLSPQAACEKAAFDLERELIERRGKAGDISVVALSPTGEWGCASTIDNFSFVVATAEHSPTVYRTQRIDGKMHHQKATQEWMDKYLADRMQPLERKGE